MKSVTGRLGLSQVS